MSDSNDEEGGEGGGGMEVEEPQSRKRKKDSSKATKPAKRRKEVTKGRERETEREALLSLSAYTRINYFSCPPSGIIGKWW